MPSIARQKYETNPPDPSAVGSVIFVFCYAVDGTPQLLTTLLRRLKAKGLELCLQLYGP